eukprot:TRINITY_DN2443_c0_g1_i58.p1 TRINITY_DN2443_c0_g1~~TRINITY_DN2443_c0_g1_i58.p1  ORF type:complete len:362 (+),score=101.10 TRINITY_DN2443_c0_g1_i58:115-1200(+)
MCIRDRVRVCVPCFEIVTGIRKGLPTDSGDGESESYQQNRANLFGEMNDSAGGMFGWGDKTEIHSIDKEIAKLQNRTLRDATEAIEVNADALENIVRQSEQTKEDLRKIEHIHATQAAADALIRKMERGMFNIGGSSAKFKPPPPKTSDVDFEVQASGNFSWSKRVLRLTDDFFLRLNKTGDSVLDTVNYSQLEGIYVHKKKGQFSIRFNREGVKPWELFSLDVPKVVRGLVERAMRRRYRVLVGFAPGAQEFDCDFNAAIHSDAIHGEGYGLASQMAQAAKQNGRVESDEFHGALQEALLQIADIGRLQQQGLEQHMNDLDDICLLYTSDAADEEDSVDLGGRRIIKKKKKNASECARAI